MGNLSTIGTGTIHKTDLFGLYNIVQDTHFSAPKDIVIGALRDFFSEDSYYHYVRDPWGFPLVPDHTDLPQDAGLVDDTTTRLYIGEAYRFDVIYYPAILVRSGSSTYVPISINREKETVLNSAIVVSDGYGNEKTYVTPTYFVLAGVWEGAMQIEILTRGIRARDDLSELLGMFFSDVRFEELRIAGVVVKRITMNPSEEEDRNDKLYKQTINLDIRTEWRRQIPISNLVEAINICVEFGNLSADPIVTAPNLEISTQINLLEQIQNI